MKDYAEKYPKAWEECLSMMPTNMLNAYELLKSQYVSDKNELLFLFGYLILEYFPKHGIEIERIKQREAVEYDVDAGRNDPNYGNPKRLIQSYDTPQETIAKALEIREKQLENR